MHIAGRASLTLVDDRSQFRTSDRFGISLHCHTKYSKEALDFVPYYARQFPVVSTLYELQCRSFERANGRRPNFDLGYWEPPLTGNQLFDSESEEVEDLGLGSIVSITDHDSIQANLEVNKLVENRRAPISMEWTVPYGRGYFHVGVHNLPPDRASELSEMLLGYTFDPAGPDNRLLRDLLERLDEIPGLLIVLNHPFWDIEMIGQDAHDGALEDFVTDFGRYIHALELNGFRPWAENRQTIELADTFGLVLVSGGDRHCLSPNAIINTSRADSFAEFAEEVRVDKRSNIVILPEYWKPLLHRQIRSISQVLGTYPAFVKARRHWSQRVFFDAEDGTGATSLSSRWSAQTPRFYRFAVKTMMALGHPALLPMFRLISSEETPMQKVGTPHRELLRNEWYARFRSLAYKKDS